MYTCAVTWSIPRRNLCSSSLRWVQWKLALQRLNSHTTSHDSQGPSRRTGRYSVTKESDGVTTDGRSGSAQFSPVVPLLNNWLCSGMSRSQTVVQSKWHVAWTQTFKSLAGQHSLPSESSVRFRYRTRENYQFEHAAVCAGRRLPDFSNYGMVCGRRDSVTLWRHASFRCLPMLSADRLSYYCITHRSFVVSRGLEENSSSASQKPDKESQQKPTASQLHNVQQLMAEQIPNIFLRRHEYRIYTKDLVFENNWNVAEPHKIVGISGYVIAVFKARFYMHSNYANVVMTVLSSSVDESLGCVQFHWRIAGLPQKIAFMFWKFAPFQVKKTAKVESEWMEGRSTFYVNSNGLIYRHVLDRIISDAGESPDVQKDDAAALNS